MISRPPSRSTRAFDVRSIGLLAILPLAVAATTLILMPSWHNRMICGILGLRPEISSHGQHARTDPSADCHPFAASDADDRRNERGQGKAQALARPQIEEETGKAARQAYDPGGARAGPALLRGRSPSSGPG